jgi:pimeloyl-ACP methyl ester carboxylesterase
VMGYSYGTSIGLALAQRRPEWISAYVGVGQTSGSGEDYLYKRLLTLADEARDAEALRELHALAPYPGETPPIEKILTVRKWARRYNGGWYGKPTFDLMFSLDEWAPEYSQADVDAQRAATQRFTEGPGDRDSGSSRPAHALRAGKGVLREDRGAVQAFHHPGARGPRPDVRATRGVPAHADPRGAAAHGGTVAFLTDVSAGHVRPCRSNANDMKAITYERYGPQHAGAQGRRGPHPGTRRRGHEGRLRDASRAARSPPPSARFGPVGAI